MSTLPHLSRLYADYLTLSEAPAGSNLRRWYGSDPISDAWMAEAPSPATIAIADALDQQAVEFGSSPEQIASIAKLRVGARAVVTGQQVGLLGGPLLTLLKAATAVARAQRATAQTGVEHVPIFWLATEDHDLAEVDQITLPGAHTLEHLSLNLHSHSAEVGGIALGTGIEALLDKVSELLGYAPICELLRRCYTPTATLGGAFARLMSALFARHGLIVLDASTRVFHALGASTLRAAIERAEELELALQARTGELEAAGYHAQVLVKPGSSLLFLIDEVSRQRQPLRRLPHGIWRAGQHSLSTADLLAILETAPERLSPNALLRPLFQDTLLPTAAYIGG